MINRGRLVSRLLLGGALAVVIVAGAALPRGETRRIMLGVPWERHTIVAGGATRDGSDGQHWADVDGDGDLDVVTPYEQSNKVSLSLNPGTESRLLESAWSSGTLPNSSTSGPEAAILADVDGDGYLDVVVGKEGDSRISILFSPTSLASILTPSSWTVVNVDASVGTRWMALQWVDIDENGTTDIVAGGKEGSSTDATLTYFTSATPRTAASWTATDVTTVGWVMNLYVLDVDGDGDLDIVYSDRDGIDVPSNDDSKVGVRWLESDGLAVPGFTAHTISDVASEYKMISLVDWEGDGDLDVVGCRSGASVHENYIWLAADAAWDGAFTELPVAEPAGVGNCQYIEAADLNSDGVRDLAISYDSSSSPTTLEGVVWLQNTGSHAAPTWEQGIVDGGDGDKYDDLELTDVDGDGDLDIVASEQNADTDDDADVGPGLGLVWFENPYIRAPTIPNAAPVAAFDHAVSGLEVSFSDTSTDSDGTIASWAWSFGDGATSTAENPAHTYATEGTYAVTLTVVDNEGDSDGVTANVEPVYVDVPTDGPEAVFLPADAQDWTDLSLPVPGYWYLPGGVASGNLTELGGGTVLTASGTADYQVDVVDWTANAVRISETASERFAHAVGVGINPSTTSIAMLTYVKVTKPGTNRYVQQLVGTQYGVRMNSSGWLVLATNNVTANGSTDVSGAVVPILHVINRTAGTAKVFTKAESIAGIYVAPAADGIKAIGAASATSAAADFLLVAIWSGADAEGLSDATLETLGWSLAY